MVPTVPQITTFRFDCVTAPNASMGILSIVSVAISLAMALPAVAQSPSVTDLSSVDAQIIESGDIVEALAIPRGTKVRAGSRPRVRLPVYFEFNSTELKPEATDLLRKLGKALTTTALESFSFSVEGHSDNVGEENFNADLSKRRADAVRSFLEHTGVAGERLRAVGRGESDPIDSNATKHGRRHNRRIEIINLGAES